VGREAEAVARDAARWLQLGRALQVGQRLSVVLELEVERPARVGAVERARVEREAAFHGLCRLFGPAGIEVLPAQVVVGAPPVRDALRRELRYRILPEQHRAREGDEPSVRLVREHRAGYEEYREHCARGQHAQAGRKCDRDCRRPEVAAIQNIRFLEAHDAEFKREQDRVGEHPEAGHAEPPAAP